MSGVETSAGSYCVCDPIHDVEVNMGPPPVRTRADTGFVVATPRHPKYPLLVDGKELEIGALSMGNPHARLRVNNTTRADVEHLGPLIERTPTSHSG